MGCTWFPKRAMDRYALRTGEKLLTPGQGIPDGPAKVHQRWKNNALALCIRGHGLRGMGGSSISRKRRKQIGRAHARRHAFDHCHLDSAVAADQHNRGDGNPAFFFLIEQAPRADHFFLRIAQNRERQLVLPPHAIGLLRRIHSQRCNLHTERAKILGKIAKLRQLAKTKGSPVAAIENQQKRSIAQQ